MTKPKRNTWMAFYPADYLRKTTRLTTEQHGAYLLLIMDYWVNGAPPDDDTALAAITKLSPPTWRRHRLAVQGFFEIKDGKWTHERIEQERAKAFAITTLRSMAGEEGAKRRWNGNGMANATGEPLANGRQTGSQTGSQTSRQTDAPKQFTDNLTSTESGSPREAACVAGAPRPLRESSGLKKAGSVTDDILKATLQAAARGGR